MNQLEQLWCQRRFFDIYDIQNLPDEQLQPVTVLRPGAKLGLQASTLIKNEIRQNLICVLVLRYRLIFEHLRDPDNFQLQLEVLRLKIRNFDPVFTLHSLEVDLGGVELGF